MLIDMKKTLIPILLAVAFAVSGCDFFRFVAGRPTSADIEAVKLVMEMQKLALEEARQKAEAQATAEKLKELQVKLTAKAGNGGKLFGAVTTKEISEGLKKQFNIDIPKQKLVLDEPIKAFGTYQVKAKLGFEVTGTVSVAVHEE